MITPTSQFDPSSVAVLLASALVKQQELSVCVVDLCWKDPFEDYNVGIHLNQLPSTISTLPPQCQPQGEDLVEANILYNTYFGIHALSKPRVFYKNDVPMYDDDFYRFAIQMLKTLFDVVILVIPVSLAFYDIVTKVALPASDKMLIISGEDGRSFKSSWRRKHVYCGSVDQGGAGFEEDDFRIVLNGLFGEDNFGTYPVGEEHLLRGIPYTRDFFEAQESGCLHTMLDHPIVGPACAKLAAEITESWIMQGHIN